MLIKNHMEKEISALFLQKSLLTVKTFLQLFGGPGAMTSFTFFFTFFLGWKELFCPLAW